MNRVIVNIRKTGDLVGHDLDVPADLPSVELGRLIAKALHWANVDDDKSVSYRIFADPPGRRLVPEESLATIGAWDGSYLTLEPVRETVLRTTSSRFRTQYQLVSDTGGQYALHLPEHILGRYTDSTSKLSGLIDLGQEDQGRSVSRKHAKLQFNGQEWFVTTLHGSSNRTRVNEAPMKPGQESRLAPGDLLYIGGVCLRLESTDGIPREEDDGADKTEAISQFLRETGK